MKFSPTFAGIVAVFTVLSIVAGGVAHADRGDGQGSDRNQSRRQAGTSAPNAARVEKKQGGGFDGFNTPRAQSTIRDDVGNPAASELTIATAVRDELQRMGFDAVSPAAQQAAFSGGPVPTVGMGGLVPNARALAAYVINTYPGVQSIGGVRSDPLPDHPSGRAIDIMIGADMGLGDAINADVQNQAGRFGVSYTLWRVPDHFNHVHVTVS